MRLDEIRLGVNIDHVATVRNARGTSYPDPLMAAKIVKEAGGDGITAHLREDRRHIVDQDISGLKQQNILPLNLEMAVTDEMQKIALDIVPNAVCLVPEKREERTTEGGLDVCKKISNLRSFIAPIKQKDIRKFHGAFICNSVTGIQFVKKIDKHTLSHSKELEAILDKFVYE